MTETAFVAARGSSVLLGQTTLTGLLRIINLAVLTRLLFQDEIGQIAFLGVIYGFMQFLGVLGLNYAASLVVPEEEAKGRLGTVRGFLTRSAYIVLVSSSGMAILLLFFAPFLSYSTGVPFNLLQIIVVIVPFSALETFLDSFLLSRYSVFHLVRGRIVFDIARVTATIGLVLIGMGVTGVMVGWLLSEVVAVIVFGTAATRGLTVPTVPLDMRPILAFAVPSLAFQTIDVTIQNADRLILLQLTDLSTLGVYDVLLRFLYMLSLISLTIAGSAYPIMTRIRANSDGEHENTKMTNAVAVMIRYVLILLVPLAVVVAVNANVVLEVLYGVSYAGFPDATQSFSILSLSYALWGVVYSIHAALRTMGEARFFVALGLGVIVFEVVGCWYLTLWLGLLGSAVVRSMYVTLLFLLSWTCLRRRGIKAPRAMGFSVAKIAVASFIAGILVLYIAPTGFVDLVVSLVASAALYLLLLFAFREVNALDFRMARALLPKRLHGLVSRIERTYIGETSLQ